MTILATIVPIFAVILIGWWAHFRGLIPTDFFGPANRLVFYVAIPAMVFSAIAKASLGREFHAAVLAVTLGCILAVALLAWAVARICGMPRPRRGAFIQNCFHGNQGYIGLAVAFYYLGAEGFARASIITGFMMILNNFLAVLVLQRHAAGPAAAGRLSHTLRRVLGHPIILAALAGVLCAAFEVRLPLVIERGLAILSGMALPLALLIIGGSLTFDLLKSRWAPLAASAGMKLLVMPALGLAAFRHLGIGAADFIPALILLATPSATVSYVMAHEMGGDAEFAVGAISASTLLSFATISCWLAVGRL
jgi:hypothetical protein